MGDQIQVSTLLDVLKQSRDRFGSKTFMRRLYDDKFENITFIEFANKAHSIGCGLISLGLENGDKVALLSENRPEWAMSYFGVLIAGGINVPLDALLKISSWAHIIRDSGSKMLIVSKNFLPEVEQAIPDMPNLKYVICMDDIPADSDITSLSKISKQEPSYSGEERQARPQDLASILYTSGTMGQSKGVMLSHGNFVSDIYGSTACMNILESDNFLSILPIHHAFGFTCDLLVPLLTGASVTYARGLASKLIIEDIKNNEITILLGVPLLFEKMYAGITKAIAKQPLSKRALFRISFLISNLLSKIANVNAGKQIFHGLRQKAGMGTLRFFLSGGAPMPPDISMAFNLLGFEFRQGYGLSETSPILTLNSVTEYRDASIGKPVLGAELRIVNPDTQGIGEFAARGPMIMQGYYNNPEATCEVLKDGWLYTGDSGWVDSDGFFYIAGRVKNVIVTPAGKNVYPEEIEYELNKSPYILESLVFGRKLEGTRGEEIEAIVVPDFEYLASWADEMGMKLSAEDIEKTIKDEVRKLSSELAEFKRVKYIQIREEEFEKTSTKKIKRYLFNRSTEVAKKPGKR